MTTSIWTYLKYNAEQRGWEWSLSPEYIWEQFESQGKRCALTGLELKLPRTSQDRSLGRWTASLDRIDSKRGYVPGNVQWIHKRLQPMKRALSDEEFVKWCGLVHSHSLAA